MRRGRRLALPPASSAPRAAPTIRAVNGTADISRIQSPATLQRPGGKRTEYGPSIDLNYLLLDFGGRSGSVESARQSLFAANLAHNATLQNTVLQAEVAYFTYMATSALLSAEQSAVAQARTSLTAAERRNTVGLATIADVLQARTALSQEQLNLETIQGSLQAARGSLASALGLPANLPFDLEPLPTEIPVGRISLSVDSVINDALRNRPDLAGARAEAAAAGARVRVARAAALPSLFLGGNAARTYSQPADFRRAFVQHVARSVYSDLQWILAPVQYRGGESASRRRCRIRRSDAARRHHTGFRVLLRASNGGAACGDRGRPARERPAIGAGRGRTLS